MQTAPRSPSHRPQPPARLQALREALVARGLDGFVVPRADEFQNEYVPPSAQRLAWLTGFTGSAGVAVVLAERAAIFVDGRYTIQVQAEVDTEAFAVHHLIDHPPTRWLAEALEPGRKLGYDPWLHTPDGVRGLAAACARAGAELVAVSDNPLDAVWHDRPAAPATPIHPHGLEFAGRPSQEKRAEMAAALVSDKLQAVVLTSPDS